MMRSPLSLALTALLAFVFCQCQAAEAKTDVETIRIGTWNIEHLGSRTKFKNPKYPDSPLDRTDAQFAKVARFIADLRVDVLALQEIADEASMSRLLAHLGDDYRFVLGTTGRYDDTRISVGFLFNRTRVELIQCEEMLDFPREIGSLSVFHRKPVNAAFRAIRRDGSRGVDFRAITVHLKASRGAKNERKRSAETKYLAEYPLELQKDENEDQDIVVLGDFNHTYNAPAFRAFTASQAVRYVNPVGPLTPTIVWFDEPIDHIAVTPGFSEEVVATSLEVHNHLVDWSRTGDALKRSKDAWRQTYSDHFPVTVEVQSHIDRDPAATFAPPTHRLPALPAAGK